MQAEEFLVDVVRWLKLVLELAGAVLIGVGGLAALAHLLRKLAAPGEIRFTPLRLQFAKYLSLGLEFQLAADILGTTVAPTWEQIGKLGAIAVLRTALNYFLAREMREERATLAGEEAVKRDVAASRPPLPAANAL